MTWARRSGRWRIHKLALTLPQPSTAVRVLIVDDVPEARAVLAAVVSSLMADATIVEAGSLAEARLLLDASYQLALIDLGLPDGRGAELIAALTCRGGTIVAAVTVMDDDASIEEALSAGAEGYLLKDAEPALITYRIGQLLAGEPSLSPHVARRVLNRFRKPAAADPAVCLTDREREVLSLIGRGLRASEVSTVLKISSHTVRDHIKAIYRKLGISSRSEATLEAHRRDLT